MYDERWRFIRRGGQPHGWITLHIGEPWEPHFLSVPSALDSERGSKEEEGEEDSASPILRAYIDFAGNGSHQFVNSEPSSFSISCAHIDCLSALRSAGVG